ncbi:MAG: malate dehydrogenase [Pseudomonadota bacterium]
MYLTGEKLAVLGAAGAIGSTLVQCLLSSRTANRITMYDPYLKGLEGAAEEMYHSGYPETQITWTGDIGEALGGASYVLSSGGAPRKEGMTREDLLRDNGLIARSLGEDIKKYCPNCKFLLVIFNPADITGLVSLVHSGLPPQRVTTLAALDSTRLQTALAQYFKLPLSKVSGCATYGGHGEKMAVFKKDVRVDGVPLNDLLGGRALGGISINGSDWDAIKERVRQGGMRIIQLRGRSSYQSPAAICTAMVAAAAGGDPFTWPSGAYISSGKYKQVMMATRCRITAQGVRGQLPEGDSDDTADLDASYEHLVRMRDSAMADGILPPVAEWRRVNPHI